MRQPAIRIVGLGTGMMGGIGFPEFYPAGGRFVAIGGRDSERVSRFLDREDIRFPEVTLTGSFEEVMNDIKSHPSFVDFVYVASIPKFHEAHALFATGLRKDLLLEKGGIGGMANLASIVAEQVGPSGIVFNVNSHYRKHTQLDVHLRSLVTGEGIEANLLEKCKGSGLGKPISVVIEYPQGYQEDAKGPLGWKAYVSEAGRGKNVSDLGIHMIFTLLDIFDARFENFEGQTYNVHPKRWNPAEGGQTFTTGTSSGPAKLVEMDMLDGSKFNGDDVSVARFILKTSSGKYIPGTMYTSQVEGHESVRKATLLTPGDKGNYQRLNGLALRVEFEGGYVTFRQKEPNTLEITDKDGSNFRVYERHMNPSPLGGPFQHADGNTMAMRRLIDEMFDVRRKGCAAVREYSQRNVEMMLEADRVGKLWLKPELKPMSEYQHPVIPN